MSILQRNPLLAETFLEQLRAMPVPPLAYCDYIVHRIHADLSKFDPERLIAKVDRPKWDLREDGSLGSTAKAVIVTDKNGKTYRVTVEEIEP